MRILLAIVVAAAAGGCAKKSSTPETGPAPEPTAEVTPPTAGDGRGYCDLPDQGMCFEFPAEAFADGQQLCSSTAGAWGTAGCATAGVIGYCTNPERGGEAIISFYAGGFADAEEARTLKCSDEGDVFEAAY